MLDPLGFYRALTESGYEFFSGVPCSYLGSVINVLQQVTPEKLIITANEGDAVAMAAGAQLAGTPSVVFMQNSGLGNAVSPLTSLIDTFSIPCLLLISWRGECSEQDEPQHQLMGEITPELLLLMKIKCSVLPVDQQQMQQSLQKATAYIRSRQRPYAFIVKEGSFDKSLARYIPPARQITQRHIIDNCFRQPQVSKQAVLQHVITHCSADDWLIVATTGYISRELYALSDRANQFYMVGSMGCVSSLAMGLALCQPDKKILILDGDGAALMRMGNMATLGTLGPSNLYHLLLDNAMHESTGGQPTVADNIQFAQIASACGYADAQAANQLEPIESFLRQHSHGSHFMHFYIKPGVTANLPRPDVTPLQVKQRFSEHIQQSNFVKPNAQGGCHEAV